MKYLIFHRESNNFDDILKDIKQHRIGFKTRFSKHLIVGFTIPFEKIQSLFILKYGDDLINFNDICPDQSPVPNKDYIPVRTSSRKHRMYLP